MGSPSVLCDLEGLRGACGFEQNITQPPGVTALKVERLAEYPGLVPAARMRPLHSRQNVVSNETEVRTCDPTWLPPTMPMPPLQP
jgi:hypothetical protein